MDDSLQPQGNMKNHTSKPTLPPAVHSSKQELAVKVSSRRDMLTNFLGVAAGGAALQALTACAEGEPKWQEYEPIQETVQALVGDALKIIYADSVAELRAVAGGAVTWVAILGGFYARGDGGGGVFYWDAATAVDDGGTILNQNAGAGGVPQPGWRRVYSGAVNVRWFGTKAVSNETVSPGAGVADTNLIAVQRAIDSIKATGGTVFFPAGTYWVSGPIRLKQAPGAAGAATYNNTTLEGAGSVSQIKASGPIQGTDTLGLLAFAGNAIYALKNVGMRKLRISGFSETSTDGAVGPLVGFTGTSGTFVTDCHIDTHPREGFCWIGAQHCENVLITGNYATLVGGWGSPTPGWTLSAYNTNAANVTMTGNRAFKCGMAVEQTGSGLYANNIFEYCGRSDPLAGGWGVAMSMASTQRHGKVIVQGNIIKHAASAIGVSSGMGQMIIADNYIEKCTGGVNVYHRDPVTPPSIYNDPAPGTPFVIRGNYFYDTVGLSGGAAITHGSGGGQSNGVASIIEGNTIVAGPTAPWAYAIYIHDRTAADIVRNNTVVGNAVTTAVFFGRSLDPLDTATQFIDNVVIPGAMSDGVPRYYWRSGYYTKTTYQGIDNATVLSPARPCFVRHSQAPAAGTWAVGDMVINTSPAEISPPGSGQPKYVIEGWVCVAAGTPGTWVDRRILTGNLTS